MRLHRTPVLLVCAALLAACYGTKVGPPLQSSSAPPGMSGVPPGPDSIALPADLPSLIAVYRRSLAMQSHHLPAAIADSYADAQIKSLSRQYSGRDDDLKAELVRRLQPVRAATRTGKAPSSAYPPEAVSLKGEAAK
jgi:hypothetical protein